MVLCCCAVSILFLWFYPMLAGNWMEMKIENTVQPQTITLTSETPCIGILLVFEGTLEGKANIHIPSHKTGLLLPEDFNKIIHIYDSVGSYTLNYVPTSAPSGAIRFKYRFMYQESD